MIIPEIHFRNLIVLDYYQNYFELLQQLTKAPKPEYKKFQYILEKIRENPYHNIYVMLNRKEIIGTGTVIIEQKLIHGMSSVAHIEDVVIHEKYKGKGYGKKLLKFLIYEGSKHGCYKVILNCSDNVQKFYEKCDFGKTGNCMAIYLDKN